MHCFPLDNTEYEANALGAWFATRERGVLSAGDNFAVTADGSGMSVTLQPGYGWLKRDTHWGVAVWTDAPITLALDAADGVLSRVDVIVLQLDKDANTAQPVLRKGAYSNAPAFTPPVRDAHADEIYVASVLVRPGAVAIAAADITDQRLNEEVCGLMRDGVTGIPTQTLYEQWAAFCAQTEETFDAWFGRIQAQFTEDAVGGLQTQIDALGESTQEGLAQKADAADVQTALAAKADAAETTAALAGKANAAHTHDDRYFTESEVTTKLAGKANAADMQTALAGKANTSHTHTKA